MPNQGDTKLQEHLDEFVRSIPKFLSWDQLQRLHANSDQYTETRGSENSSWVHFEIQVLEDDHIDGKRMLHIAVFAHDAREGRGYGSAYSPFGSGFIYFQDGTIEMQVAYTPLGPLSEPTSQALYPPG
jgi:hypothetical protein